MREGSDGLDLFLDVIPQKTRNKRGLFLFSPEGFRASYKS